MIHGAARDAANAQGRAVIVVGPPGVGKTSLLLETVVAASTQGFRVLRSRGTSLEQQVGFGLVRQLLQGLAREIVDGGMWPESVRTAVRVAGAPLGLATATQAMQMDPWDAECALLELVIELARSAPLALVADDVHWADESSLRVLVRAAERCDAAPLLIAVATRPPSEPGAAVGTADLLRCAGVTLLRPEPLSGVAATRLVRSVTPVATEDDCRACVSASNGNPLFVKELAVALSRASSSGPVRVPPSIAAAVERRLASLTPAAQSLAQAVAVFEPRATLTRCVRLVEIDWARAISALDELIAADVLEHGTEPIFVHPVVRTAVHDAIAPARRAEMHSAAAAITDADGVELDVVAAHLLQAPARGAGHVVDRLAEAARSAFERGTPETAIAYLRRAVAEPPASAPQRAELLLMLGHAEMRVGSMPEAEVDLRRAIDAAGRGAPNERLQAVMTLGQLMSADDRLGEAVHLLETELRTASPADDGLLARVETVLLNVARMDADANAAVAGRAGRLRRLVHNGGEATPEQLATVAAMEAQAGISAEDTAMVALQALDQMSGSARVDVLSFGQAVRALIAADRLNEARAIVQRQIAVSRHDGVRFAVGFLIAMLAEAHYRAGELPDAERCMREALEPGLRWQVGRPAMVSILVKALLERGDGKQASELIDTLELDRASAMPSQRYPVIMGLHARGRVRLDAGDAAGALLDFEQCGPRLEACAELNPALIEWRSDAAWALIALGDRERAQVLADDELVRARAYGAARSIGIALRARAAAGPPAEREDVLREAVSTLRESPARLTYAHACADLGSALERGTEAREMLGVALEIANQSDARLLAQRVRRGLSRAGARPRRSARTGPDSLTLSERRVTELAAAGLTNSAISQRLFVTVRTVELHLTNSYRKLGIESRAGLSRAFADAVAQPPERPGEMLLSDPPPQ